MIRREKGNIKNIHLNTNVNVYFNLMIKLLY